MQSLGLNHRFGQLSSTESGDLSFSSLMRYSPSLSTCESCLSHFPLVVLSGFQSLPMALTAVQSQDKSTKKIQKIHDMLFLYPKFWPPTLQYLLAVGCSPVLYAIILFIYFLSLEVLSRRELLQWTLLSSNHKSEPLSLHVLIFNVGKYVPAFLHTSNHKHISGIKQCSFLIHSLHVIWDSSAFRCKSDSGLFPVSHSGLRLEEQQQSSKACSPKARVGNIQMSKQKRATLLKAYT